MFCLWEGGKVVKVRSEETSEIDLLNKTSESSQDVQFLKLTVNIYHADAVPRIDAGLMAQLRKRFSIDVKELLDLYVQVCFGDLTGKTSKSKSATTHCWNEQIIFVNKFPLQPLPIIVQVRDDEIVVNNILGIAIIDLINISNADSGGFLPTFGPCYVYLHNPKDINKKGSDVSYRGKLLMSIFSEIVIESSLTKPYVAIDSTAPLPEVALGKDEDFLLFSCLSDVIMIDNKLAEKKNVRFSLQFGHLPEEFTVKNKNDCMKACLSNLDNGDNNDESENIRDVEYSSEFMTPVRTNRKYYHLPIQENKPCLFFKFSSKDNRRRMYVTNILEKMCLKIKDVIDKLQEYLDMNISMEISQEISVEKSLRDLETYILYFLKVLKRNWDMFSSRTILDIERKQIFERIIESLACTINAETSLLDRPAMVTVLGKLENILLEIEKVGQDPQSVLPDVTLWLESNRKRVGYSKIASREILHSVSEMERGRYSGKIKSMFFRSFSKRQNETILAKADIFLWMGLLKHIDYCLKMLPQGFEIDSCSQEEEAKFCVPRVLTYFEKLRYELRAHLYQARSLPCSDASKPLSFFAQVLIGHKCRCTQIKENSLNPIWDETLVFRDLLFYGRENEMAEQPPEIVVEIYSLTASGKSNCIGRDVISMSKALSKLPSLKWFSIGSTEAEEPSQILAAFEILKIEKGGGDSSGILEDTLNDIGPILQIPSSIRPRFSRHRVEILFWGLRELKRIQLMALEAPRIELECGGQIIPSSTIINYKKHSNFVKMLETIDLDLPEREDYFPAITIRLQDCRSFGRRDVLASHVLYSLRKYVVKTKGELLELKFEELQLPEDTQRGDIAINVELSDEVLRTDSYAIQNVKIPWTYSKISELNSAGEEEDWWTRYYISAGGMHETKPNAVLTSKISETDRRKTLAELVIGDKNTKLFDNLDEKAFVIYPCELENVPEFGGFEEWLHSFKLTRGAGFSRLIRAEKEKTVAVFKGCFRIYKLPLPPRIIDPLLPFYDDKEGLFNALPENKPMKVLVRVYVVKAIGLTPSDITNTTDAYIAIQAGNQKFADKDNYISKQLNPVFGKCFEFVSCFPRDSMLRIQVMDWDLMGSDDLIGETKIDLENRFYSRCRPSCGLPRTYETSGPNAWRDVQSPLEILTMMCQRSGLGTPRITKSNIRISDIMYDFGESDGREAGEHDMALYLLHRWQDIAPGKHPLVPEHLETRTLYHPSKPGQPQGKLVMWIDMYPENTVPPCPPRDISTRKPVRHELRVIIWNTEDVVLSDQAFLTGEKMSDIYVKGQLTGKDSQSTDIHYRSLTGEGNFNWRFVFPFDYLSIERKVVVTRKASVFSWDETEYKLPPELKLQVWDADYFKTDDYLGEVCLHLHHFPRGAKSPDQCRLDMLRNSTMVSLFKQRRVRGWWPVSVEKGGRRELTGKIEAELHLLTKDEADTFPVGLGRKEPDPLKEPKRPATSFVNFMHPLKTFRYAFWKRYRKKFITVLLIAALAFILLLFVYSVPGYTVKKIMKA